MLRTQFYAAVMTVVLCGLGSAAHASFYAAPDQSDFTFDQTDITSVFSSLLDDDPAAEDSSDETSTVTSGFSRKRASASLSFTSNLDTYSNYYSNSVAGQSILQWWLRWKDNRGLASLLIDRESGDDQINSPAPVPVPAAALLFSSALGLLFFPRARRILKR